MPVQLELRSLPYTCQALLAICSDLDETPDAETYFELMRFLNTHEETSMGPGVNLEVGNTIYFDMPPGQFSYWNSSVYDQERIRALIRSGHIDCLHSFGDLATTRAHAARALDELARYNCQLRVWIDHAVAPTNLGSDIMQGHGDDSGHPAYHADLTVDYGVRYVWRGRVTSVIGQDQPSSLSGLFTAAHPLASALTVLREGTKQTLARCGSHKYALHAPNQISRPARLRDGRDTTEFLRCNPHWAGVSHGDRGDGIHQVLTSRFLDRLAKRQGACILYTHLGKLDRGGSSNCFDAATVSAFQQLAEYHRSGKILVTTTRRLLDYVRLRENVAFTASQTNGLLNIEVHSASAHRGQSSPFARNELCGLTVYVDSNVSSVSFTNGTETIPGRVNPPDGTGRRSVSIPWPSLQYSLAGL